MTGAVVVLGSIIVIQLLVFAYERRTVLKEIHRLTELVAAKNLGEFKAGEKSDRPKEHIDLFSEREKKRKSVRSGPLGGIR
jgi:hypothetical protein